MSRVENIDRYLRAYFASQQMPDPPTADSRTRQFITISRQAGTGAHSLAETLLETFSDQPDTDIFGGWQIFDKTLCEIVVEDQRFATSLDSLLEEEYRSKTNDFFHQVLRSTVDQSMLISRVFLVVRTVAGMGKAIIVGRAGSHVTQDMPQGVSIRLIAPESVRTRRAMEANGLSERDARAGARKRDAARARMLKEHFGADITDPSGYDVTWNVGNVSYQEMAASMVGLIRNRAVAS